MSRVLVVEDESAIAELISLNLRHAGFEVTIAASAEQAQAAVDGVLPDLVLLDWMLPKLDGLVVCRRIRERHVTPILMLTARGEETDIILGLEVGADDYLAKPFRIRELLARVRAILRRSERMATAVVEPDEPDGVTVGPIRVSLDMRSAELDGVELELTPKEFDLLALFMQNPGRAFSRDYLLQRIWGDDVFVTDRTVDTHVQRLRKKLGDEADMIRTVWGIGYRFQPSGAGGSTLHEA